tara:strand:- start:41 stop:466 length:426 start_codon:yes stop_codon:yes gene_type:complete
LEHEILAEITQIKWTLVAIFAAIVIVILYNLIAVSFRVKATNTQGLLMVRDNFVAELSLLESKGEYEELLAKSDEMLSHFSNDLVANWYSAIGHYKNHQPGAALSALGKIKQINSAWSAEAVDSFVEEIKSEMDGPRAGDT